MKKLIALHLLVFFGLVACKKAESTTGTDPHAAFRITKNITYNNINVDVVIDKPQGNTFDVLMVFHGTVGYDSLIQDAANNTLDGFKEILDSANKSLMIISVAYPEENLLFGDNIQQCEAALLWLKNKAANELGVTIHKIFLAGHSQGGYQVTKLNTMHATDGVIANAPGPLNLVYRCQLEESGQIANGTTCTLLKNTYGTTAINPDAYFQRSLLNFTTGHISDLFIVQGMSDTFIQLYSWPTFKDQLNSCTNCQSVQFFEVPNGGHPALFGSPSAQAAFNQFISQRR
jgi:hypothetical protein